MIYTLKPRVTRLIVSQRLRTLFAGIALLALFTILSAIPAFSQSCALCYTQAASATTRMIQALRSGILILIVPPTVMSVGMIFIVYNKRNQFRQDNDEPEPGAPKS
jgi:hypothetical protein